MVLDAKLHEATAKAVTQVAGWGATFINMLPSLVVAVIVVILFVALSFLVERMVHRATWKLSGHRHIGRIMGKMSLLATIAAGLILAMDILNLDRAVASMLAGLGIVGLAVGLGAKDIFANFASGLVLHFVHPFRIGDLVKFGEIRGYVENLQLRSTIIRTTQGQRVTLPNSTVMGNAIINYTISGARRVDLDWSVSQVEDLPKAEKLAIQAVESLEMPLRNPSRPVELFYEKVGDYTIDFKIRFWTEPEQQTYLRARSEAIKAIKQVYAENGVGMPSPIRAIDFGVAGGTSLREELEGINLRVSLPEPESRREEEGS
jgi:small conductance mechanosensitive channel